MPDALFATPELAEIYDLLDSPERPDLTPYVAMVDEFNAHSVIDLGCGTGVLACRLAALGKEVIGIDPAAASLAVAQRKAYADHVRWITGSAEQMQGLQADLITMTANVAQVFITDAEWVVTLRACRAALTPGGRLVFETRDPAKEAWKDWNRENSYQVIEAPDVGRIESWVELVGVQMPLVSFRHVFVFQKNGRTLTSDSTLRFRTQPEITDALSRAQLTVEAMRGAPDRPGREFVYIAQP
ncbi:MAG: SAM-dependent methyltransferase [Ktedonobacterales bacterium]|jgi:ubiquinone/menaquinone biosynthesis C-methylase UbiE|nr:MAG: SAM-dependent methyltransferase [Ktedonobacterales bacterium]